MSQPASSDRPDRGPAKNRFAWDEAFEPLAGTSVGWAHHGLTVTSAGEVVAFHPAGDALLFVDPIGGGVALEVPCAVTDAHDLIASAAPDDETLWIADCGFAMCRDDHGDYSLRTTRGRPPRVVQLNLDGSVRTALARPDLAVYDTTAYVPTAVAVAPSGDVWVGDGYGASLVHCFDRSGRWIRALDGTDGLGRFDCPHGLVIFRDELYIADREHHRVEVYDLEGRYRRSIGDGVLERPSALAVTAEGDLAIAELTARVTILTIDGTLVARLGHDPVAPTRLGWPNRLDDAGRPFRPRLQPGRFNSPHGIAVDCRGAIYVCEWLIGGRISRLRAVSIDRPDET